MRESTTFLRRHWLAAWLAIHLCVIVPSIGFASSEPSPVFDRRRYQPVGTPATGKSKPIQVTPAKPIPREWIVGGIGLLTVAGAILLYLSIRVCRASNLFDQQYRFPSNPVTTPRLGGSKCGGHVAAISWASDSGAAGRSGEDL